MNTRVRSTTQAMKAAAAKLDKEADREKKKTEMPERRPRNAAKAPNRFQSRRERKIALQQDVDKLKKKLRHEENVHRALERAFTRPLGALPRLPPYLPSQTLELLAEVAVLEEEVVRLEEQVVNFRQGLYQEAIFISSSKNGGEQFPAVNAKITPKSSAVNKSSAPRHGSLESDLNCPSKATPTKQNRHLSVNGDQPGKENQNSPVRNLRQSPVKKVSKSMNSDAQTDCAVLDRRRPQSDRALNSSEEASSDDPSGPNKLSEQILKCLLSLYSLMASPDSTEEEPGTAPSVSGSCERSEDADYSRDPYGIAEFGTRDVGPYRHFRIVDATSFRPDAGTDSSMLIRKLKTLLRKLASVDLSGLTHQQKLPFWINIYNSCMMNAFLEQGIPTSPHTLVALMPKATVNVGRQLISAMTIEHFILRLPYSVKQACPKGIKSDEMTMKGVFGLEWPEPLVTFALSCGSWSSPAVRVYTASHVQEELETAKREYLQAAVAISIAEKLAIPKLLHWYLLDFAKDVESLMDWICLQLPGEQRSNAVECLDAGRRGAARPRPIRVVPYDFRFRYILAT